MRRYGLHDWFFQLNGRKKTVGLCLGHSEIIALSVHFCEMNPLDKVEDTIRQEIAHALVGVEHGHEAVWQGKARELGANPERLCRDAVMPDGRWRTTCPSCQQHYHRHRRPRRLVGWYCPGCGPAKGA
jgi:predicted SprT family Zn-dependent metalloprotease